MKMFEKGDLIISSRRWDVYTDDGLDPSGDMEQIDHFEKNESGVVIEIFDCEYCTHEAQQHKVLKILTPRGKVGYIVPTNVMLNEFQKVDR